MANRYYRKNTVTKPRLSFRNTVVDILPNVLLQLTGSVFSFELLPFISHPSVKRELQHVRCALTAFVL